MASKCCGVIHGHMVFCQQREVAATREELLQIVRDLVRVTNEGCINPAFPIGAGMQAQITDVAKRACDLLCKGEE